MAIQTGFDLINGIITDTFIFNISWIISILMVIFTLLIITRDTSKWKGLAFPITVMWHVIGIKPSNLMYVVTAIFFVIDVLSLETIGNILTGNIRRGNSTVSKDLFKSVFKKNQNKQPKMVKGYKKAKEKILDQFGVIK